jgi:hypothetical protein
VKLEYAVAAVFLLIGTMTAVRSLRNPVAGEDGRARFLIAIHEASKSLFWLSLAGFFLAYGILVEPQSIRYAALIPIGFAALRLLTAALLART